MADRNSHSHHYYSITYLLIHEKEQVMNQVIYLVGLVVVVMAILSFVGLA